MAASTETRELLIKAHQHPAYNDACREATWRAYQERPQSISVYFDGERVFVRSSADREPADAECVCTAQHCSDNQVQLRFAGGHTAWVPV